MIVASRVMNKLTLELLSQLLPVANRTLIERKAPERNANGGCGKQVQEAAGLELGDQQKRSGTRQTRT